MIIEVDRYVWDDSISQFTSDLMYRSDYLQIISASFQTDIKYLILKYKGNVVLALCVFYRNKKVYFPDNYTYTPLWLQNSYSERKKNEFLKTIIVFLKKSFNKIHLKLKLDDIRAFKWEGFTAEPRYTYLRINSASMHNNIKARLNRKGKKLPVVEISRPTADDIDLNVSFLKELKTRKRNLIYNERLLENLNNVGYLKSFTIKIDEKAACSFIVLVDEKQKKAFTLMINGADRGNEYFHALIYKQMLNWFDAHAFEYVDFCGANISGITEFKSYFNPQLKVYYILRYSRVQKFLEPFFSLLRKL